MARRPQEELVAEYHRVYDAVEASVAVAAEIHGEALADLPSRNTYLAAVERGEATMSQIIAGARDALSDLSPRGGRAPRDQVLDAQFLSLYKQQTGRSFWDDAPQPKRRLKVILARDAFESAEDARFVMHMLADGDVPSRSVPRANALLAADTPDT